MISHTRMTRSRLYVLLDAFEADMRAALLRYVLDHMDEQSALGASFEKADLRRESENADDPQSIVQYLDMREAYDILNRHRASLPEELGKELRDNTESVNSLVPTRNRVMHGRPLQAGDPENAVSICQQFVTRYWVNMKQTLDHLVKDPAWEPAFEGLHGRSENILHNLPMPDYDETGLIGRSGDCEKITSHLLRRREPIITVTGEGGIGKTATALEVAFSLVDNVESPYECILWVSLKKERLTVQGVEEILNSIRDLTGAAQLLGQAFDAQFTGGIRELAEILEGIETLLIIDNLETVDGSEVVSLYEMLPDSVTFLFTSRIGVGQFERRFVLGPLKESHAARLFREFAKSRDVVQLMRIKQETVNEVVKRLRYSPLAIRWYILSVESGQQPNLALQDQNQLLDFCVGSVYESMKSAAREVFQILFAIEHDATFEQLVVLSEMSLDEMRVAIHELLSGSMVRLESDTDGSLVSRVGLTEAARSYAQRINPPASELIGKVLVREEELRRGAERMRMDQRERRLAPNVVRISSQNEEPVAYVLQKALASSRDGLFGPALALVEKARSMNPDFPEVDRVLGFILSQQGQVEAATSAYMSALRKADEEGAAIVAHFFSGHLARKAHQVEKAVVYARQAHNHFHLPETAQALGNYLVWTRNYNEGQEYLEWAYERAKGRHRLITLTSIVESWRRWAEYLLDHERRPVEAAAKANAGFSIGLQEIKQGTHDLRLADNVLECVTTYIRCLEKAGADAANEDGTTVAMLRRASEHLYSFERCRNWSYFPGYIARLVRSSRNAIILSLCEQILQFANPDQVTRGEGRDEVRSGVVCSWNSTYGFISNAAFPKNIFFPAAAIEGTSGPRYSQVDLTGLEVRFIARADVQGRDRADWVQLVAPGSNAVTSDER